MLLVIIGHCVDGYLKARMFPNYTNEMQYVFHFLYSFHMPLFFILSGFLYYYSYNGSSAQKIVSKAMELIMLYFGYSIVQCLVQLAMASKINKQISISDILLLSFYTVPPYWYLYVLSFLYIISYAIRPLNSLKIAFASIICTLSVTIIRIDIFSISDTAYYLLFFLLGGIIALNRLDLKFKKIHVLSGIALYIIVLNIDSVFGLEKLFFATCLSFIIISSFCTFDILRNIWLFNLCGKYCLPIYLIHSYMTAGTRVILKMLHCESLWLYFCSGIVLGVLVPILFYNFCASFECLKWIFKPAVLLKKRY